MNPLRLAQHTSLVALLALVVAGTSTWQRRVSSADAERYERDLRTCLAIEHRLTAEVLEVRFGSVGHFDGIVRSESQLRRLDERLRAVPGYLGTATRDQLAVKVAEMTRVRDETSRSVDRFERSLAVLRNSLRYLATLSEQLEGRPVEDSASTLFIARLGAAVRNVLLLQGWHERAVLARLARLTVDLEQGALTLPAGTRADLPRALPHLHTALRASEALHDLTARVVDRRSVAVTEAAMATFSLGHQAALERGRRDTLLLVALGATFILAAATSVSLRFRAAARALERSTAQLEEANATLEIEKEKEKSLAKLKSQFVSMTSHEFRTPLSVILSSSEMLEAYDARWSAEKKAQHFRRIESAAQKMTRLLDAILMIGRSDAGMLTYQPRPLDLDAVCRDVVSTLTQTSGTARIVYDGPGASLRVLADETLLRHILDNLLSNALKYSPDDRPVRFTVEVAEGLLVFIVEDQGIGIPEEDRATLFETFQRGSNVGDRPGTGLGLSIVTRAVELHGGSLDVRSEVNAGSTFTVRIPCSWSPP